MMWKMLAVVAATALGAATVQASAQDREPSTIVVRGKATVEAPADWAKMSFAVSGEGVTQVAALKALTEKRARIEDGLNNLAKTKRMTVTTSDLTVHEVRSDACDPNDDYRERPKLSTGPCAVIGYSAYLKLAATLAPADRVGDAVSLAAQLGALDPNYQSQGLDDDALLADRAAKAALEDARRQAQLIATATGTTLGPVVRISDARQRPIQLEGRTRIEDLKNSYGVIAPSVQIALTVDSVRSTAEFEVVYAIAR